MSKQIFGSALARPWALVKWGGNQPNGNRPSTTVAYLTDPIKNDAGEITGYEGALVEFYRKRAYHTGPREARILVPGEPFAQWHFRFKPRKFSPADICEFFPCGKSRQQGPAQSQVREAKKRVPRNPNEEEEQAA